MQCQLYMRARGDKITDDEIRMQNDAVQSRYPVGQLFCVGDALDAVTQYQVDVARTPAFLETEAVIVRICAVEEHSVTVNEGDAFFFNLIRNKGLIFGRMSCWRTHLVSVT